MVGFPGEGEDEFGELLGFVEDGNVDYLGIFEFSPEEGTQAYDLEPEVPRELASARARTLLSAMEEVAARRGKLLLGTEETVLVDDAGDAPGGRTPGQGWELDGRVLLEGAGDLDLRAGDFVRVNFTRVSGFDLVAEPLATERSRDVGETA